MIGKLLRLFRGRSVLIPNTNELGDGFSRKVDIGDPGAGGTQIVLSRIGGVVYALDSYCPHEGGRIMPGPLADGCWAVCPLHNYGFDPRTGKAKNNLCKPAKTYRVVEKDGSCEVWV